MPSFLSSNTLSCMAMQMHLAAKVSRLGVHSIWATFLAVNSMSAVCMSTQSC